MAYHFKRGAEGAVEGQRRQCEPCQRIPEHWGAVVHHGVSFQAWSRRSSRRATETM